MPTQKQSVPTKQLNLKIFKFTAYYVNFPSIYTIVIAPEILRFPNNDGFLFNLVCGKTLREGDENVFGIRRNPQTTICPIKGIKGKSELTLRMATCFAPTTPNGGIQDSPFTSAAAEAH